MSISSTSSSSTECEPACALAGMGGRDVMRPRPRSAVAVGPWGVRREEGVRMTMSMADGAHGRRDC